MRLSKEYQNIVSILESNDNIRYDIIQWLSNGGYLDDFKIDNFNVDEF